MPDFGGLAFLRLHPIQYKSCAVGTLPQTVASSGRVVQVNLETCGWSKAALTLRLDSFWELYPTASQVLVTLIHFDGRQTEFTFEGFNGDCYEYPYLEYPVRLAAEDGSFVGSVTISIRGLSVGASNRQQKRTPLPTYTARFHYEPSPLSHLSFALRSRRLVPFPYKPGQSIYWVTFKGCLSEAGQMSSGPLEKATSGITEYRPQRPAADQTTDDLQQPMHLADLADSVVETASHNDQPSEHSFVNVALDQSFTTSQALTEEAIDLPEESSKLKESVSSVATQSEALILSSGDDKSQVTKTDTDSMKLSLTDLARGNKALKVKIDTLKEKMKTQLLIQRKALEMEWEALNALCQELNLCDNEEDESVYGLEKTVGPSAVDGIKKRK